MARFMGPEAFRAFYLERLRALTFNSKPVIDELTIIAEDNRNYAPIVVDCIKDKIIKVVCFSPSKGRILTPPILLLPHSLPL